jgi:hypothetical protein
MRGLLFSELERIGKEGAVACFKVLEELGKTTKSCQYS